MKDRYNPWRVGDGVGEPPACHSCVLRIRRTQNPRGEPSADMKLRAIAAIPRGSTLVRSRGPRRPGKPTPFPEAAELQPERCLVRRILQPDVKQANPARRPACAR